MNQNTTVDSDLQKAIDDITKSTSNDPLFSDPVAAPAPVGPFETASMAPAMPPRAPMPTAPRPTMPPKAAPRPSCFGRCISTTSRSRAHTIRRRAKTM